MTTAARPPTRGDFHRTQAVAQLRAAYDMGPVENWTGTDDDLLRFTAVAARTALEASSVSIERFELEQGQVRVLVNDGDLAPSEVELPEQETYPIDEYAVVRLMEVGATGIVVSADDPDADPGEVRLLRELGKHSSIQVPIMFGGKSWGVLFATRAAGLPDFVTADLELAQAVAAQVAAGLAVGSHVRRVSELALLDSLTGLANRAAVQARLERAVLGHRSDGRVVSVVICDVNGLKRVNDQRGHAAGDRLLIRVGELFGVAVSRLPGALAGRLGGDEFCLVAEDTDPESVIDVFTQLCRQAESLPGGAGVACGIASTSDDVGHIEAAADLVRLADGAQYRAKRSATRVPVVAGRATASPAARPVPGLPGGADRRTFRAHASGIGLPEVVDEVVELLDHAPSTEVAVRLAVVGDSVSRLVDAASWWLSDAPQGGRVITVRRHGTSRAPLQPGPDRDLYFTPGLPVDLQDYPQSLRAIRGGWFTAAVDDEASEPGERSMLVESGYTAVLAAGGESSGRGWLLEIFLDAESRSVPGLGPALRALVALALTVRRSPDDADPAVDGDSPGSPTLG